jgi:hypothetical protein
MQLHSFPAGPVPFISDWQSFLSTPLFDDEEIDAFLLDQSLNAYAEIPETQAAALQPPGQIHGDGYLPAAGNDEPPLDESQREFKATSCDDDSI